jgi:hypothetical protein
MLERFASHSQYDHAGDRAVMFIDNGYGHAFTQAVRKMRRVHYVGSIYGGSLPAPATTYDDERRFISRAEALMVPLYREALERWKRRDDDVLQTTEMTSSLEVDQETRRANVLVHRHRTAQGASRTDWPRAHG